MRRQPLRLGQWAFWWTGLFALYLLLIVKLQWQELSVAVFITATAATAAWLSGRAGKLRYRPHFHWLRFAARLPPKVVVDCATVIGALWPRLARGKRLQGVVREVPFKPGGNGPVSRARRALVVAAVSLAPNTFVIDLDAERGVLIVHQLVPSKEPPGHGDREWPL
ncbi:MAG TPA: hypothetical protein VHX65_08330 [Pirellulales bacterium]|jgi:multisubunit Na+/H+ antiporter MnhE subunit|nr:hypothetical protein [Pirellulales bacterium]